MSASGEEMKKFLAKRGYDCDVEKVDNTFKIQVSCKNVDSVCDILAGVSEPGRFIVSVKLSEIADIVANDSGLVAKVSEAKAEANKAAILCTDNYAAVSRKIADLYKELSDLEDRIYSKMTAIEHKIAKIDKPWYRKW